MEIISGQQEDKASGRIGNEFNLYPFGSLQFLQLLENKTGRWGEGDSKLFGGHGL